MRLSIITINYNNKQGLQKTIDSVISQTFKDFEWIVIDGGSTDGSKELIEKNQKNITYWCSEPDNGVYHAMNKGIARLRGSYVLFLNSGDWLIDDNVLKTFVETNPMEDIVYGYVEREIEGVQQRLKGFLHQDTITMVDLYYRTIPHQGTFFKTNLFQRFGVYDENLKILADRKFYVESIIYGDASVKFIPFSISYFDAGGISGTSIYEEEKKKVLGELFPPRVYQELQNAKAVREIRQYPIFRVMYSILYRAAVWYAGIWR